MIKGFLSFLLNLLIILIILHAIGSWIPKVRESGAYLFLDRLVSPLLEPIRKIIPPTAGFDFSPLILLMVIYLIKSLLKL